MVPLAALLLEEGHRVTGSDHTLYPPMSTTLERLGIPVAAGLRRRPRPAGLRRRRRRQRRAAGQRRGGRGGPPRAACPLAATGGAPVPAAGQDLDRHHGHPRQDHDLGADVVAAARLGTRPGLPRRRRDEEPRPRLSPRRRPALRARGRRVQRGVLRPRRRSSCTTSRGTSSSATSSSTTPTSMPTSRRCIDAFRKVVALVPADGVVVVNADDPRVDGGLAARPGAPLVRVSLDGSRRRLLGARHRRSAPTARSSRSSRRALPTARLSSPLLGLHNVRNALGAIALARGVGLSTDEIARALPRFARRAAAPGGQGREERHPRRRRLRAPSDRGARHAPGGASALSGAEALGALRAALEHGRPQDVRGRVRGRVRRRRRAGPRARLPRAAPRAGQPDRPRRARAAIRRRRQARVRSRRRSTRSPESCAARRAPATCCS